ncbi:MAG TPA: oxidoreductase [Mycobacteriales bacterium]|nr:oxidoreductase [Mycobacteriales bacterium]
MGLRDRFRRGGTPGTTRTAVGADVEHLQSFAAARRGVEGFVEPQTLTTSTTLVLVAGDGEWTRRRVPSREAAFDLGKRLAVPVYDVAATGYPQRMRDWTAARKAAGETRSH